MHLSGHRAIRALAVFLVLALGFTALVPMTARAAVQVTGVVNTCGGPLPVVSGATVTLIDVNGIVAPSHDDHEWSRRICVQSAAASHLHDRGQPPQLLSE